MYWSSPYSGTAFYALHCHIHYVMQLEVFSMHCFRSTWQCREYLFTWVPHIVKYKCKHQILWHWVDHQNYQRFVNAYWQLHVRNAVGRDKRRETQRTASTDVMSCSLVTSWNDSVDARPRMPHAAAITLPPAIIDAGYEPNDKSTTPLTTVFLWSRDHFSSWNWVNDIN